MASGDFHTQMLGYPDEGLHSGRYSRMPHSTAVVASSTQLLSWMVTMVSWATGLFAESTENKAAHCSGLEVA